MTRAPKTGLRLALLRPVNFRRMAHERLRRELPLDRWWTTRTAVWLGSGLMVLGYFVFHALAFVTSVLVAWPTTDLGTLWNNAIYNLIPEEILVIPFIAAIVFPLVWVMLEDWRYWFLRRQRRCTECAHPIPDGVDQCVECGAGATK